MIDVTIEAIFQRKLLALRLRLTRRIMSPHSPTWPDLVVLLKVFDGEADALEDDLLQVEDLNVAITQVNDGLFEPVVDFDAVNVPFGEDSGLLLSEEDLGRAHHDQTYSQDVVDEDVLPPEVVVEALLGIFLPPENVVAPLLMDASIDGEPTGVFEMAVFDQPAATDVNSKPLSDPISSVTLGFPLAKNFSCQSSINITHEQQAYLDMLGDMGVFLNTPLPSVLSPIDAIVKPFADQFVVMPLVGLCAIEQQRKVQANSGWDTFFYSPPPAPHLEVFLS
ncbi:hypothetical protein AMTR_s00142p00042780 [Amborella trichopoda]|uniref:Uncharacterized protein n=1 Tax=Amborella trichopoda TaxID=13333 RepID=W1PE95_AMBTC|nr:hypothetical protein AMTR_s00142p00042780 [Amborella trichopoda]